MDLTYGSEMEEFRQEVESFLDASWPLTGDEAKLSRDEGTRLFRERAIAEGYLCRSIPKRYGGSEQPADALRGQVIREEFGASRAPMEPSTMNSWTPGGRARRLASARIVESGFFTDDRLNSITNEGPGTHVAWLLLAPEPSFG